jgi:signal peptidase I
MMPTLLDGDFIIVNKYVYGLRWPVFDRKVREHQSEPQRGDVVVFRYPLDPSINYIKRSGRPARGSRAGDAMTV